MAKRMNFKTRRQQRKEDAEGRQETREKRSDRHQLEILESRGHGHCREAEVLRVKLTGSQEPEA